MNTFKLLSSTLLFVFSTAQCQVAKEKPITSEFSFVGPFNEQHSSILSVYPLSNTSNIQFLTHYDSYAIQDRWKNAIGLKQYLTKRLYFLGGAEVECARDNSTGTWGIKPRTSVNLIMGYEVKENFLLETKANFQLNQTSWGAYGDAFVPTPAVYTIGGRWKF